MPRYMDVVLFTPEAERAAAMMLPPGAQVGRIAAGPEAGLLVYRYAVADPPAPSRRARRLERRRARRREREV